MKYKIGDLMVVSGNEEPVKLVAYRVGCIVCQGILTGNDFYVREIDVLKVIGNNRA